MFLVRVADPFDVDDDADQHEPGQDVAAGGHGQVGQHLASDLSLIGVDELVLGVDVDVDAGVIVMAERSDRRQKHLAVGLEHLLGTGEGLFEEVFLPKQFEKVLQHDVTSI